MNSIIKNSPTKVGRYISAREREYIEENLLFFIDKERNPVRSNIGDEWYINEDRETSLRYLILDYVLKHFNLKELYVIFFLQDGFRLCSGVISESRKNAIININNNDSFTPEEKKRLKRKVWDTPLIIFGLVLEFVHLSDLFWDYDEEDYVLPNFNKS